MGNLLVCKHLISTLQLLSSNSSCKMKYMIIACLIAAATAAPVTVDGQEVDDLALEPMPSNLDNRYFLTDDQIVVLVKQKVSEELEQVRKLLNCSKGFFQKFRLSKL